MDDTDTCDWPRCHAPAVYTYSAATPTVGLCEEHWGILCIDLVDCYRRLGLKPKPPGPFSSEKQPTKKPQLSPNVGFAGVRAVMKRHAAGLALRRRLGGG